MKKIIIIAIILSGTFYANAQNKNTVSSDTIKVWGNCGMCEKTIEKAANSVKGVVSADWNQETNLLILTFNATKTSSKDVQKAIAAAGYDTQDIKADDKAYNKLHACCQYERKDD